MPPGRLGSIIVASVLAAAAVASCVGTPSFMVVYNQTTVPIKFASYSGAAFVAACSVGRFSPSGERLAGPSDPLAASSPSPFGRPHPPVDAVLVALPYISWPFESTAQYTIWITPGGIDHADGVVVPSLPPCAGAPPQFAGDPTCALLSVAELAPVASSGAAGPGRAGTDSDLLTCDWKVLVLAVGPLDKLQDRAAKSAGLHTQERAIDDLGTSAWGSEDSARVVVFVETDRGHFSITVGAGDGMTIDRLVPIARLVAGRL